MEEGRIEEGGEREKEEEDEEGRWEVVGIVEVSSAGSIRCSAMLFVPIRLSVIMKKGKKTQGGEKEEKKEGEKEGGEIERGIEGGIEERQGRKEEEMEDGRQKGRKEGGREVEKRKEKGNHQMKK